jgi:tetratricopeptide (TPR) repeat protein
LYNKALNIYRSAVGNQSLQVAATLNGLADASAWMSDYPLAEHYQREALSIFQETVSRNHPDNAVALANLGSILTQRGKYREAEQVLNEALQIERNVFGADNSASRPPKRIWGLSTTKRETPLAPLRQPRSH